MNLKNYTSQTPASTSIDHIERRLVLMGAKNINKQYEAGLLKGITFLIDVKGNTVAFELPANVEAVFQTFWLEVKRPTSETKQRLREQTVRTAWKIISDWVEVQASMIRLKQADVLQVFLPYAIVGKTGETLYHQLQSGGFKALASPQP